MLRFNLAPSAEGKPGKFFRYFKWAVLPEVLIGRTFPPAKADAAAAQTQAVHGISNLINKDLFSLGFLQWKLFFCTAEV